MTVVVTTDRGERVALVADDDRGWLAVRDHVTRWTGLGRVVTVERSA